MGLVIAAILIAASIVKFGYLLVRAAEVLARPRDAKAAERMLERHLRPYLDRELVRPAEHRHQDRVARVAATEQRIDRLEAAAARASGNVRSMLKRTG